MGSKLGVKRERERDGEMVITHLSIQKSFLGTRSVFFTWYLV